MSNQRLKTPYLRTKFHFLEYMLWKEQNGFKGASYYEISKLGRPLPYLRYLIKKKWVRTVWAHKEKRRYYTLGPRARKLLKDNHLTTFLTPANPELNIEWYENIAEKKHKTFSLQPLQSFF